MEDHKVRVTVLESGCPRYKPGDEIYFDGAFIDKERSAALCMGALSAIYPCAYAARRGGSVNPTRGQSPYCGEAVKFLVQRLD